VALAFAGLIACGESDSDFEQGTAVGIRAELVDDSSVVSDEIEIGLLLDIEAVARKSRDVELAPQTLQSSNQRVDTGVPKFEARKARLVESLSFADPLSPKGEIPGASIVGSERASLQPDTMRTLGGGMVCWTALYESAGSLVKAETVSELVYYTGDGLFAAVSEATSIKLPTTLGFISAGTAIGCVQSPDGDTVSVAFLESLLGIHFTSNVGFVAFGASVFYSNESGFERGFQAIASAEKASASFFPGLNFDLVIDARGSFLVPPTQLIDNDPRTVAAAPVPEDKNPLKQISTMSRQLGDMPANDYRSAMLREHGALLAPTMTMLSTSNNSAPGEDRPAGTMGDFFEHFIAHSDVDICRNCPNTSLDGIMAQMERGIVATDGDGEGTRDAVLGGFLTYRNSTPDAQRLAMSQRHSASSVRFSTQALADVAAEQRGDVNRYVSRDIVELEGKVGERVSLEIGAQEIADLVGVEALAVEGALVQIDGAPRIGAETFVLADGVVQVEFAADDVADLLFVIRVDLSSATGPFPSDVADWTIRPAMRRLRAEAGPVEHIFIMTAPNASPGAPVQLQAMLADGLGATVKTDMRVRFYDADDRPLGEATTVDGVATVTTSELRASIPDLSEIHQGAILVGGEEAPGFIVTGDGISRDAEVFVDGASLADTGGVSGSTSSEEMLLYFEQGLPIGPHTFFVRNPGGQQSETLRLDVD